MSENNSIVIEDINAVLSAKKGTETERKSSLFTLIVYTEQTQRAAYFQVILESIAKRFPCRIISIYGHLDTKEDIFKVSATRELIDKENNSIPCELIRIEFSENQKQRVPFVVIPHLVTDLPVYLIWGKDPTLQNDLLNELKKYARRLIIDAQCTPDLKSFSEKVAERLKTSSIKVMDLNWAQISGWRDVFREIFDTEDKISDLKQARAIVIEYWKNCAELSNECSIQPIYFQGWLASRLKLKFSHFKKTDKEWIFYYQAGQHPLEIRLVPKACDTPTRFGIVKIDIQTHEAREYVIESGKIQSKVGVYVTKKDQCDLPYQLPLPTLKRGSAFINELLFGPFSTQYLEMLNLIKTLEWKA